MRFLLAIVAPVAVLFTSCLKEHRTELLEDKGSTVTAIQDVAEFGSPKFFSLDLLPATQVVELITLKVYSPRGATTGTVHVVLEQDTAAVTAAGYSKIPANAQSGLVLEYDVPVGGSVTVPITLNMNNLNLASTYGIAFKIKSVSQGVIGANDKAIVVGFGLKNRWDGKYRIKGSMVDVSNALFVGTYEQIAPGDGGPLEWELVTSGPTQVVVYDNIQLGIPGHVFSSVGDPTYPNTYYGSFGLKVNFDPNTNAITSVTNYYGQLSGGNQRSAILDATGVNAYNPSTKVINIKYIMQQFANFTPPGNRTYFNETWTYVGPR